MKEYTLKIIYSILAKFARRVIKRHNPFVIGITGSVGKSTTKEIIYKVLSDQFGDQVRKNYGNLNAEIGIPLTILGYTRLPNKLFWPFLLIQAYFRSFVSIYPKYLILEMGVEHPGDLKYFGTIVRPNLGIITSTEPVHLVNFADKLALAEEKISLRNVVKDDGILIVNGDDQNLRKLSGENITSIGIDSEGTAYRALGIKIGLDGTEYRIETLGQKIAIKSKMLGRQFVYANLFAFAVGQYFDIQSLEIKKSLISIKPLPGRMNLIPGLDGMMIIDDTYNASPAAVKAAIAVLSEIKARRRVLILGNMNELGNYEKEAHLEVATFAKSKVDIAIFAGPNAALMAEKFGENAFSFADRTSMQGELKNLLKPHDVILIKASQNNNYFEEVTKLLMADRSKSASLLVRQNAFWLRKKQVK